VTLEDTIPPGFHFVEGSARLIRDGQAPVAIAGTGQRPVEFGPIDFAADETLRISYILRVGSGVTPGRYENRAEPIQSGSSIGNAASANVNVVADPILDLTTIVGKVFHDRDGDGWQDEARATDLVLLAPSGEPPAGVQALAGYVAGSTTIDFGEGPIAVDDIDGRSALVTGLALGDLAGRISEAGPGGRLVVSYRVRAGHPAGQALELRSHEGWRMWLDPGGATATMHSGPVAWGMTAQRLGIVRSVEPLGDDQLVSLTIENLGVQEEGLPGTRLGTVEGLLVETDAFGRYHLAGIDGGHFARGRNFALKVDPATLPPGATFTTENPRVLRITPSLMNKINFGVQLHAKPPPRRRLTVTLDDAFFKQGRAEVRRDQLRIVAEIALAIQRHGAGTIRISLGSGHGSPHGLSLGAQRARQILELLREQLDAEAFRSLEVIIETPAAERDRAARPRADDLSLHERVMRALELAANWIVPAAHAAEIDDASWSAEPEIAVDCLERLCERGPGYRVEILDDSEVPAAATPATGDLPVSSTAHELLPGGGVAWLTQDPAVIDARLDVKALQSVLVEGEHLAEPVPFTLYSNYLSFIERWELLIFRGDDDDRIEPVRVLSGTHIVFDEPTLWDGIHEDGSQARRGEEYVYVLRVWAGDTFDETRPRRLEIVGRDPLPLLGTLPDAYQRSEEGPLLPDGDTIYGESNLATQAISLRGSRVRVYGRGIPAGGAVRVNGQSVPIGEAGNFAAEQILPLGDHVIRVEHVAPDGAVHTRDFEVTVDGTYFFVVGLADITLGGSSVRGGVTPVSADDHFDDSFYADGRLAFYLKGKIKGRYLITAQLDTLEGDIAEIWGDLDRTDPRRIFRNLDADRFYPVYGDDSTTIDDVNSIGRFYVRVEWDASEVLWGNFNSGFTGTEFAQYDRSLYGARVQHRLEQQTSYGESRAGIDAFVSLPQTLFGHNEFLGTGGSLYYLRDQDIAQGSAKVWVEVRERDSGRVIENVTLQLGRDYEVDEIQGRILLARPLQQVATQMAPSIIKDVPLDGNVVFLLVDYEYIPNGFDVDDLSFGARAQSWVTDQLGVGGTYVRERRKQQDYQLWGTDLTLRAGRATYLKLEYAESQSEQAFTDVISADGGLTFEAMNQHNADDLDRSGYAIGVEARVALGELTEGRTQAEIAAWWRQRSAGFSTARFDVGTRVTETGAEASWRPNRNLSFSARAAEVDRENVREQRSASLQSDYRLLEDLEVGGELRVVQDKFGNGPRQRGVLFGGRLGYDLTSWLDLYIKGQVTLDHAKGYGRNDQISVGGHTRITDRWGARGEISTGNRGSALQLGADFRLDDAREFYGTYTLSTDRTRSGRYPNQGIVTVGQRQRLSNQLSVFTENQFQHGDTAQGIASVFGLDYTPNELWSSGLSLQNSRLDGRGGAPELKRDALATWLAYDGVLTRWRARVEWRRDVATSEKNQWLVSARFDRRWTDDLKLLAHLNWSQTLESGARADGRFVEASLGLAYRPVNNDKLDVLGKITFLSDLPSGGQLSLRNDERAAVVSIEGLYDVTKRIGVGGKYAYKLGALRAERAAGRWFQTQTHLALVRGRYHVIKNWDLVGEYRVLGVAEAKDIRHGPMVAIYRHIKKNFKIGVGYSFTDFDDDLTNLDYKSHGWFVNFLGKL